MNTQELIKEIENLNKSLTVYKNKKNNIIRILEDSSDQDHQDQLKQAINRLKGLLESLQLSASGKICPSCKGTGRI
jgi:uncharacterized protein YaaR (DUF327 family)